VQKNRIYLMLLVIISAFLAGAAAPPAQEPNPDAPDEVVKLIFIHHSCGENWLTDGYGDLGRELGNSNYFVSDTNYGWGPDAIGDRTDIPNWIEWFRSDASPTYMEALFNESGQHSGYTRTLEDPGGENQIIMFKSCFPNSALTGSPNDPPGSYEELSVGGAKYVYNQLLEYFASRPDKLFVAITAPPLSEGSYARNARAFNLWLLNDWLEEADYELNNVAVFDFYNILSDPNAHHRYHDGRIEHVQGARDTLAYPSGDDHPSEQGSRKATEEFIPLLNIFYQRWQVDAPQAPPAQSGAAEPAQQEPAEQEPLSASRGQPMAAESMLDDFEGGAPAGSQGWQAFWDEATATRIACAADGASAYAGAQALLVDFDVEADSWATCVLLYEELKDWSAAEGLTFYLQADQPGLIFEVEVYGGSLDGLETYLYSIETTNESIEGWVPITLTWADFTRAAWEDNPGAVFDLPERVVGVGIGLPAYEDIPHAGTIRIDDLALSSSYQAVEPEADAQETEDGETPGKRGFGLPCASGFLLPAVLLLGVPRLRRG